METKNNYIYGDGDKRAYTRILPMDQKRMGNGGKIGRVYGPIK